MIVDKKNYIFFSWKVVFTLLYLYLIEIIFQVGNQQIVQQSYNSSPRIINFNNNTSNNSQIQIQTQNATTAYVLQDQQNSNNNNIASNANNVIISASSIGQPSQNSNPNGQIFLNINNRIVPVQTVNLKQANGNTALVQQQASTLNNQQNLQLQQQGGQRIQVIGAVNSTQQQYSQQQQQQQPQMIQIRPQQQQQFIYTNEATNVSTNGQQSQQYIIYNAQQQQQQQNSPQTYQTYNTSTGQLAVPSANLTSEIPEKMRLLEQIQKQLRAYQVKISTVSAPNGPPPDLKPNTPVTYTTQQIQAALTVAEQNQLQKLITQRKTVQQEIQQLQHKLLAPNTAPASPTPAAAATTTTTNTTNVNQTVNSANLTSAPNSLTKLQLYQQVLIKLNNFKTSKTVTVVGTTSNGGGDSVATTSQQLQLTSEELQQLKKLLELQNQLQNELGLTPTQIQSIQNTLISNNLITKPIANQTIQIVNSVSTGEVKQAADVPPQQQQPTYGSSSLKLNECSLTDKYKILELIKQQLQQLKNDMNQLNMKQQAAVAASLPVNDIVNQQQQIKERFNLLLKKQSEIHVLIAQQEKQMNNGVNGTQQSQQQQQQASPSLANIIPTTIHIVNNTGNGTAAPVASLPNGLNSPKQTPIKIRNVIASSSPAALSAISSASPTTCSSPNTAHQRIPQQAAVATPLRALVINNNSGLAVTATNVAPTLLPLASVANLQKLHFPHVKFKCLNFEELAVSFYLLLLFNDEQ